MPEAVDRTAPKVSVLLSDVNVFGGKTVTLETGKLSIGGTEAATWTDDKTVADKLKAEVTFDGKAIGSGTALSESGTLTVTVTDEAGNSSSGSINLSDATIIGLESLRNLDLQVDKEVNLLERLSFAD